MFNIINYLINRYSTFVVLNAETSTISLSRSLYNKIVKNHEPIHEESGSRQWTGYKTSFWKTPRLSGAHDYSFFVNPNWVMHDVSNPNMVYQSPILKDPNGHMSIKAMMPCVQEILQVYGIPGKVVRLKIDVKNINGEPYYRLRRSGYKTLVK